MLNSIEKICLLYKYKIDILYLYNGVDCDLYISQLDSCIRTSIICHIGKSINLIVFDNRDNVPNNSILLSDGENIAKENLLISLRIYPNDESSTDFKTIACWVNTMYPKKYDHHKNQRFFVDYLDYKFPIIMDSYRQYRYDQENSKRDNYLRKFKNLSNIEFRTNVVLENKKVIVFALYWADIGGAESFAIYCMQIAKKNGYKVVVCLDNKSHRLLIDKIYNISDAIYSFGDFGTEKSKYEMAISVLMIEKPTCIHIHHSNIFYNLLPVIRYLFLNCQIFDTTHIFEHVKHDFVIESAKYSRFIDFHHVISKNLQKIYIEKLFVKKSKVIYFPLSRTVKIKNANLEKWNNISEIYISFIGRFVNQKRPILFLHMANKIKKSINNKIKIHFLMMGDGVLKNKSIEYSKKIGIYDNVTFLNGTYDVNKILCTSHIIIMPSENEGLALVAMEAVRANCLVISCNVGGQNEIISDSLLISRYPIKATSQVVKIINMIINKDLNVLNILKDQESKIQCMDKIGNIEKLLSMIYKNKIYI